MPISLQNLRIADDMSPMARRMLGTYVEDTSTGRTYYVGKHSAYNVGDPLNMRSPILSDEDQDILVAFIRLRNAADAP